MIWHDHPRDLLVAFSFEMPKRLRHDRRTFWTPEQTRTMPGVEPALYRAGKALVIVMVFRVRPRRRMDSKPRLALTHPTIKKVFRDGITESKRHKVNPALLLPVGQPAAAECDFTSRIEKLKVVQSHVKG